MSKQHSCIRYLFFVNFNNHQSGYYTVQNTIRTGLFIGLLSTVMACNLITAEDDGSDYPTSYPVIEYSQLQEMNEVYHENNNYRICSTLNQFGFTGFSDILFGEQGNPCERDNREVIRIAMNNPDTLEAAAKRVLLENQEYTGVNDTSGLVLTEIIPLPGCINCGRPDEYSENIEWKLTFDEQQVDSILVEGTEITVVLDALGVNRIWGNWYSDFKIPDFVNYGYLEVQEGVVGWEIDMRNYTGSEEIYTISSQDVPQKPEKVYLPHLNSNSSSLEIRACWKLDINYNGDEAFEGWHAYIDIHEGALIKLAGKQDRQKSNIRGYLF